MKKIVLGIVIGILLSYASVTRAADVMSVAAYPVKLFLNGQLQSVPDEYETLNYQGHVYVPLRFLSDQMHGKISFDAKEQALHLTFSSLATVPLKDYSPQTAIENGDIVSFYGQLHNTGQLSEFTHHVDQRKTDWVRLTTFTDEGDPIVYELLYDGNRFWFMSDTSRDAYGDKNMKLSVCSRFQPDEAGTYWLSECSNRPDTSFPGLHQRER